ncbi:hypothetical protein TIFTF001_042415 [Ficus carica]|uniref:Uncharacterized protein n=1 Tax=Ficus carica TaxID=3494 RepID=A0AA88CY45_FICCA|nr:hypothetical protein TIFTF001_042415 [Ficus carica]
MDHPNSPEATFGPWKQKSTSKKLCQIGPSDRPSLSFIARNAHYILIRIPASSNRDIDNVVLWDHLKWLALHRRAPPPAKEKRLGAASTVSIRSGGRGWRRSRNKDSTAVSRYGTVCQGQHGPTISKGLGRGRGSVTRANTFDPDDGLLEVPKGELIRGSAA